MKIGVIISSFRLPADAALERAAAVGAQGVQLWNAGGEHSAENLDAGQRRQLRQRISALGLEIASLCADYGKSYALAAELGWLLPKMKEAVDLATDLGAAVVTTHVGEVPEHDTDPNWGKMVDALADVGGYAAKHGVRLATETGPEDARSAAPLHRGGGQRRPGGEL